MHDMEHTISATELVRKLGDVLARIRYRGDSFLIERNGAPVARLGPVVEAPAVTAGEALSAWMAAALADAAFARDLEEVGRADAPPESPWDS
jgi:antitoxin (DNA-binding transcriptional repressor) of toxin-antitoxin stability system